MVSHLARSGRRSSTRLKPSASQVSVSAFDHQYARGIVPPVLNPGVDWYPHLDPSRYCPAVNCDRCVEIESGPHPPATARADVPG